MSYRALILADSPSLYWPLDSTYGATDQSGNGRDGTGAGGIAIGGYSGSPISGETTATDFDGSGHYIASAYNPFTAGSTRSFAGWAYRDTDSTADTLFSSTGTGGTQPRLACLAAPSGAVWEADTSGANGVSLGVVPNAAWFHWALIFDDSTNAVDFWINGSLSVSTTEADPYAASPGNFQLGARGSGSEPGDFKMAHVAVWERALTASEIQSHYVAGIGSGLVADRSYIHEAGRGQ